MLPQRRNPVDTILVAATFAVIVPGLAMLYSSGQTDFPTVAADIWKRQIVWLALGVLGAMLIFRVSSRVLEWITAYVYILAIALLILTLVIGTGAGTAASSKSWLAIGGVRIGQPAEFAKLATVLMLARHLAGRRRAPQSMFDLVPAVSIAFAPFVLVGLQPDLGSAIVLIGILFVMMFWAGVRPAMLLLLASPVISLFLAFSTGLWGAWIVAITLLLLWIRPYLVESLAVWGANVFMGVVALRLWNGLAGYQQARILSFINPESDPRAAGWNLIQSKVAIGSGGLFGNGFTSGPQKRLAFLPAQHTDFVYSIVGEEFGFFGVVVTLGLFFTLLWVLIRIARDAVDPFSGLVVIGVAGVILVHVVENVGMTVGLLPVTGIPLPFFSYGGSFLLVCLAGIGLALRTARDTRVGVYVVR
jgi:rod shape determining protein RodA